MAIDYYKLYKDPRYFSLPKDVKDALDKGDITLDDIGFVDLDKAEQDYQRVMPKPPVGSFFGAVAPTIESVGRSTIAGGVAAATAQPASFLESTEPSALSRLVPGGQIVESVSRAALKPFFLEDAQRLRESGQEEFISQIPALLQSSEEAQRELAAIENPTERFFAEAVASGAANFTNFLPLLGGGLTAAVTRSPTATAAAVKTLATIPAVQAYTNSYLEAKSQNKDDEFAHEYALGQSGLEYLFEAAAPGAGKSVLGTIGKRLGYETLSEAGTEALQQLGQRGFLPEAAPETAQEAARNIGLAGTAAALIGGPLSIPGARTMTEMRRQQEQEIPLTGDPAVDEARTVATNLATQAENQVRDLVTPGTGLSTEVRPEVFEGDFQEVGLLPQTLPEARQEPEATPAPEQPQTPPVEPPTQFEEGLDQQASPEEVEALRTEIDMEAERTQREQRVRETLANRQIEGVDVYFDPTVREDGTVQFGRFNPETGRTEINAAHLEDEGDIVAVSVHEIAHNVSQAKDEGATVSRRDLSGIIGQDRASIVNSRIQSLAQSSPIFKRAVERASASNNPEAEMLSYALEEINRAREAKQPLGRRVTQFVKDTVATIKGGLARAGFTDLSKSFNENDLYRLGKVMTSEYGKGLRAKGKQGAGATLESFGGVKAKNAPLAEYARAEELEISGATPRQIWSETGWRRGVDDKWRFEIDDSRAKLTQEWDSLQPADQSVRRQKPLEKILDHDGILKNYPELQKLPILKEKMKDRERGYFMPGLDGKPGYIAINASLPQKEALSVLLHEAQHAIQMVENFANGGSVESVWKNMSSDEKATSKEHAKKFLEDRRLENKKKLDGLRKKDQGSLSRTEKAMLNSLPKKILKDTNDLRSLSAGDDAVLKNALKEGNFLYDAYMRIAGEAEARNTQKRQELTEGERREVFPTETQDVPDAELTIGGKPARGEQQRSEVPSDDVTETPAFKKWFGDSKVVDAEGRPLVVYHGSPTSGITEFRGGSTAYGIFFTDSLDSAVYYNPSASRRKPSSEDVYSVYLKAENPADLRNPRVLSAILEEAGRLAEESEIADYIERGEIYTYDGKGRIQDEIVRTAEGMGYDAVVLPDMTSGDLANSYVVFRPEQIKSATGNRGTFSPESPNILESRARPAQPKVQEKVREQVKTETKDVKSKTEPVKTGESWQRRGSPVVGRKAEKTQTRYNIERAKQTMKGLFSQIANIDRDLYNALKSMKAEVQLGVAEAIQSLNRLESAVQRAANYSMVGGKMKRLPKGGVTALRLSDIQNTLDQVNNAETSTAREEARSKLAKQYPGVYAEWQNSRLAIDRMTLEMMKEILGKPGGLTNKDVRLLREMKKNLGDYLTRQYAAFQGDDIKQAFIRDVFQDWNEASKLSPEDRKNLPKDKRVFEDAKNFIRDHWMSIGDFNEVAKAAKEDLNELSLNRFKRLYEAWVDADTRANNPLPSEATVEQREAYIEKAIQDLQQVKQTLEANGKYEDKLEQVAVTATKDILESVLKDSSNPLVEYFQVSPGEGGILKQRKRVPPPIRRLLGEISDPLLQLHQTTFSMHRELARMRMLSGLYQGMEGQLWVDAAARDKDNEGIFTRQLTGEKYGPLQGKWVRDDIAESLSTIEKMGDSLDGFIKAMSAGQSEVLSNMVATKGFQIARKGTMLWKKAQIVYNTTNMLADFLSTTQSIIADGNIPWANKEAREFAFGAAYYLINSADRTKFNDAAREAMRNHLADSAQLGEIQEEDFKRMEQLFLNSFKNRELAQNFLRDNMNKMASGWEKTKRVAGWADRLISDTKAMSDVVGKLYNYNMEKQFLQRLEEARKKDNPKYTPKTERQIEKDAADTTDDTNIGYHRAAPIARTFEGLSMGTLLNFFTETIRTTYNKPMVAKDMWKAYHAALKAGKKNEAKVILGRATERTVGALVNLAFNESLMKVTLRGALPVVLLALAAGGGDEDEEAKKVAVAQALTDQYIKSLPPESRSKAWIMIGKTKDGKPVFFDMSRFGVNEPTAQPFIELVKFGVTGDMEKFDRAYESMKSLWFMSPLITKMADIYSGKEPTIKRTHPEMYRMLGQNNALGHVYDVLMPRQLKQMAQLSSDESSVANMTTAQRAALSAGASLQVYDPKLNLRWSSFDYKMAKDEGRKSILQAIEKGEGIETLVSIYNDAVKELVKPTELLNNNIAMSRMIGANDDKITEILTEGAGGQKGASISKGDVLNLLSGTPTTVLFTSDQPSFKNLLSKQLKAIDELPGLSDLEKAERRKEIEDRFELYSETLDKINEVLIAPQDVRKKPRATFY